MTIVCATCGDLVEAGSNRQKWCKPCSVERQRERDRAYGLRRWNKRRGVTTIEKFWSYVDRSGGPDACWPWLRSRCPQGYGFFYPIGQSSPVRAHRWLLGYLRGAPLVSEPRGVEDACHHCDNPPCCNPAHLYIGTRKENIGDAVNRGRLRQQKVTHCPQGHPYDGENLYIRPDGARSCRACRRRRRRLRRALPAAGD